MRLDVLLPPEMKPAGGRRADAARARRQPRGLRRTGPSGPEGRNDLHIRAKALRPGDLRVRFQLLTDDMQTPVTKEESTGVFADD